MKKLLSLLLTLCLALTLVPAALAAAGDANLGRDLDEKYSDNIQGAFVLNGELYIAGYQNLYVYHDGDAELTPLELHQPESGENESQHTERIFSDGERAYALIPVYSTDDSNYTFARLEMRELIIGEDGVDFGEPKEIDAENLTVSYGSNEVYMAQINSVSCSDGRAYLCIYDDMGTSQVYVLDLETGSGAFIEDLQEPQLCTPWEDGKMLIGGYDYNGSNFPLVIYDPESESITPACDPIPAEGTISGLAYSQESQRLFYLADGYIMAAQDFDFENAQPVAEFSSLYGNSTSALLLPGDRYVYADYDVVAIRSTNPEELPETRITISNSYENAVNEAYYAFGNTHGDVAVVRSTNYMDDSALIESMMNRDSSIDIYLTSVQSQAFDALFQRGYMAELDSEKLQQAVEGMYPALQDVLMRDGKVVALPVSLYGWIPAVSIEGFEKIGISRDEIPTNWPDFLDFLETLPDKLPEDGSVRIFEDYQTQSGALYQLMDLILEGYQDRMSATGSDPSYDTPELRTLLEKLFSMDMEALGLKEDDEEENGATMIYSYSLVENQRTYTLVEMGNGCTLGNFYNESEPWPLAIAPGEDPLIPLQSTVAFVNPFSEHFEIAQEFMEALYDSLETSTLYNISDQLNDPVRNSYYERNLAELQKQLEESKAALEKAEPVDKPLLEQNIADLESAIEYSDKWSWEISPESLQWYRSRAQNLFVKRFNFASSSDELYTLSQQLFDKKIDVATFLKGVDQKVRMMALEGN